MALLADLKNFKCLLDYYPKIVKIFLYIPALTLRMADVNGS